MSESLMQVLHVAPLALIALTLVSSWSYKLMTKKSWDDGMVRAALLVLCSVGIIAGHNVHHGELLHFFDPCFGYAATLMGIAFKSTQQVKSKA